MDLGAASIDSQRDSNGVVNPVGAQDYFFVGTNQSEHVTQR
ncbi:hypothetical protein HG15A2_48270 [Adhaeretor mobilis]|uniref:Uncharacterized protein n=1 Tax=Adhaeretor mobilis TaxID=1930276 RepID=A0A517N2X1_9BACT|nr:hypothetical protein HG15A2_48270 [Adhaeretor mobilis]